MKFIIFVSLCFHLLLISTTCINVITAQPKCYDTGNFTKKSTYAENRQLLLSSLASNVGSNGGFFNTTTIGQNSDKVYGLVVCVTNSSQEACSSCVSLAVKELTNNCTYQKEALFWGGDIIPCIVRYANRDIFAKTELEPYVLIATSNNDFGSYVRNLSQFDKTWTSLTEDVKTKAAAGMASSNNNNSLKIAGGVADFSQLESMYELMAGTPDINEADCRFCLLQSTIAYQSCCYGQRGGVVKKPSCYFRWDWYPFYNVSALHSPPLSPPLLAAPPSTPQEKSQPSKAVEIFRILCLSIGVPIVVCAVGISAVTFVMRRSSQRNRVVWNSTAAAVAPQPSIVSTGLDESTIESYEMLVLGDSKRVPGPNRSTCAICISEYSSKETLRCIPECHHCFHADCIDEWLRLNGTCPVCRNSPSPAHPTQ